MSHDLLLSGYVVVLGLLGVFGLHRLYLVVLYLRSDHDGRRPQTPSAWPIVTVQLPIYNEIHVVDRLLDAVAALDYPRDRLEIQVLDDSDDATAGRVAERVEQLARAGVPIRHLPRARREGFKAGALAAGLARARGELVCVFDADFAPRPDFLRRTVPYFEDPGVGLVQARWSHLNRSESLLTRIQAVFLDAHFAIEHAARAAAGRFFNFNGTAGVWRRAAIEEAGGWQHDTLTEDLDLSYRAQLAGWRFVYCNHLEAPAELPGSVTAFKSQQRRWTRGAVQTARKLLPRIWRSSVPVGTKLEATFHLTANLAYLLMVCLAALVFPVVVLRAQGVGGWVLWLEVPVLVFGTGAVCLFFVVAQAAVGRSPLAATLRLPVLMALGAGLALNNTLAALRGLGGPPGVFERTPKTAAGRPGGIGSGTGRPPYRLEAGLLPWLEAALALYFGGCLWAAVRDGLWFGVPVLALFAVGYAYVAGLAGWEAWRERAPSS